MSRTKTSAKSYSLYFHWGTSVVTAGFPWDVTPVWYYIWFLDQSILWDCPKIQWNLTSSQLSMLCRWEGISPIRHLENTKSLKKITKQAGTFLTHTCNLLVKIVIGRGRCFVDAKRRNIPDIGSLLILSAFHLLKYYCLSFCLITIW